MSQIQFINRVEKNVNKNFIKESVELNSDQKQL